MANYQPASSAAPYMNDDGNRVVYIDSTVVTVAPAVGDHIRPCKVAGGTKVDRVTINNGDLDTGTNTLTATIGFEYIDGTAATPLLTAVAAAGANALTGAANTAYDIWPPVVLERDAYLVIIPAVAANALAASATVYGKVEGENIGEK